LSHSACERRTDRAAGGGGGANFISAELAAALIKIDVLRRENDAGQLARKLAACLLIYERHFEPIALAGWHTESVAFAKKWDVKRLFVLFWEPLRAPALFQSQICVYFFTKVIPGRNNAGNNLLAPLQVYSEIWCKSSE